MWQAKEHTGFQLFGEPGTPAWCDAMTADSDTARSFYTQVFGYTYQDMGDETMPYALFTVPGQEMPAGGIGGPDPNTEGPQLGWSVAFQVDDVDAAAQRIREAGGTIIGDPSDFEYGRMAVATGSDGEPFAVMTPNDNMQDPARPAGRPVPPASGTGLLCPDAGGFSRRRRSKEQRPVS